VKLIWSAQLKSLRKIVSKYLQLRADILNNFAIKYCTMKAQAEVEVKFYHSWPLTWKEEGGQILAPAVSLPGKEPLVPSGYMAGWVSVPDWTLFYKNKIPFACLQSNPGRPSFSLIAIPTEVQYGIIILSCVNDYTECSDR
jgi:hypothetical protein